MKIRKGFVSNSSSTAFILVFDKPVESPEKLRELLFNNIISNTDKYKRVSEYIFRDLEKPNDWDRIGCEMQELLFQRTPYEVLNSGKYQEKGRFFSDNGKWKEEENRRKAKYYYALDIIKKRGKARRLFYDLCKKYNLKNRFSYVVEYDDGYGDDVYHSGEYFRNIDCISISHH